VWHAQYIASNESGNQVSALDAVFGAAIEEARAGGARYFDFGTSNESAGQVLNDGLFRFKSEFGGGGVAHEYYELAI
jgi:lipid II:glycine glycyltransferase (peptidoglycan interpeptide bridge formation enzyme)